MKNSLREKFKRALILSLIWVLVFIPAGFGWAQEITPPPEPTPTQVAPTPEAEPSAPPSPEAPSLTEILSPTPTPTPAVTEETSLPTPTPTPAPPDNPQTDGVVNDEESGSDNAGEATVITEEATNSVVLVTSGNLNENTAEEPVNETESVTATESASISETETQSTQQQNQAEVTNQLEQTTNTGGNSASFKVGDARVETGNANTSGTLITALNSNIDGVAFNEYNLTGEQEGDLVLNFEENCLTDEACPAVKKVEESESFQTNEAELENTLVLAADSGDNQASFNTQGDSTVQTGDANVAATVLTFLNNNLAGNVSLGVVNIFGTLVGDIILPQEAFQNQAEAQTGQETSATFQSNEAEIENNLLLTANTGENEGRLNTNGQTKIETGEASAEAQVVNVVNNNLVGGNWWLVLVNEAGEWLGKILGAPEGENFAAAEGMEFTVAENGEITVGDSQQTTSVTQDNEARLVNNLALAADSGHNETSKNTGGDSTIKTGNARVVASLLNFVNNNLSSQSKILVTVVNVFGRWVGDFRPPGMEKETEPPAPPAEPGNNDNQSSPASNDDEGEGETAATPVPEPTLVAQGRRLGVKLLPPVRPETEVLSVQTKENPDLERGLRINLAWLIVTLPLFFLAGWLKKFVV